MLSCGDTFLLPNSPEQRAHLWIVLTTPEPITYRAVCVSLTTRQPHSESTVILRPGDHPFIKRESIVHYALARWFSLIDVQQLIDIHTTQFTCEQHARCSDALLVYIQRGLLHSKMTPNGVKDYCRKMWGINPKT
jgi:hypothetical protein